MQNNYLFSWIEKTSAYVFVNVYVLIKHMLYKRRTKQKKKHEIRNITGYRITLYLLVEYRRKTCKTT